MVVVQIFIITVLVIVTKIKLVLGASLDLRDARLPNKIDLWILQDLILFKLCQQVAIVPDCIRRFDWKLRQFLLRHRLRFKTENGSNRMPIACNRRIAVSSFVG